ncbi:MAG: DUF3152 domain-containing protein [Cellulomonas sp.]|nr:DUF3152 domain-containing protein [Cellulomonas sp.]
MAGAGAGAWASPDTGPGAAVVGAWDAVTGSARTAVDQGGVVGAGVVGPDLVGAAAGADWFASRTGTPSASRSLIGGRATGPDWADATNEVITAPVTGPGEAPQLGAAALPALVDGLLVTDVSAGLLSLAVPASASGELVVVPGAQAAPGTGAVRTVRIEVERGLAVEPGLFALTVMTTLNDPRGWGADGSVTFARTDADADADLRVVLASPRLVDRLCAPLATAGKLSCGTNDRAVLNVRRWIEGAAGWDGDNFAYRQYLVNHEVGHLLGHRHEYCTAAGKLAPLMQQQSGSTGACTPNAWPFPSA